MRSSVIPSLKILKIDGKCRFQLTNYSHRHVEKAIALIQDLKDQINLRKASRKP